MRSLTFLLKISLFVLAIKAKHDGQVSDDDDGDDDKSSSPSSSPPSSSPSLTPTSTQLFTSTSTILLTSTLTSPDGASSSAASANSVNSALSPVPSGALQLSPPANTTTCEGPVIFTWEYESSTSVPLTIVVTNERAVSVQSSPQDPAPLIERTLTTSVDARVCVISWPRANVPPGSYTLLAMDTGRKGIVSAQSSPFFVSGGPDASCLNRTSSSSAALPADTATDTTNDTADPPSSLQGTRSMSTGAIVGTIAGILVGVGGLLFVFSLPWLRRRILRSKAPRRPGGPYMLF